MIHDAFAAGAAAEGLGVGSRETPGKAAELDLVMGRGFSSKKKAATRAKALKG